MLAAAEGKDNKTIAAELGTDRLLVGKWRKRFATAGLAGIEKDAPRGGRKPAVKDALTAKVIEWTTQRKPSNAMLLDAVRPSMLPRALPVMYTPAVLPVELTAPLMVNSELLRKVVKIAPTMAVKTPAMGG